ncbi:YccF domain-containing protein [Phenylobacterium sp.]|uniref:YccF domain-containing protein n=1 Tax=Phenylobacterium sp. TaxID=1871053 RepID=UPI0039C903EA
MDLHRALVHGPAMRLLLNILWFVLGGWISGTLWLLAGVLLAITIIGLPWTPAAFRIAGFSYWPFGRVIVERDTGAVSVLLNILWLLLAGWWLALHHLVLAAGLAVTIIGIPFAWQHVKLAMLSLIPVGKGVAEV